MSTEPLFGRAFQAPMVTEPKATPRVTVSQVAPRPMAAASISAKHDPKRRRTLDPVGGYLIAAGAGARAIGRRRHRARTGLVVVEGTLGSGGQLRGERVISVIEQAFETDQGIGALARQQHLLRRVV